MLFIDRDGTLIREPEDFQIDSFAKLRFLPGVIANLGKIARETDYLLVMVTNQDGLGTDAFPETDFTPVHDFMIRTFADEGIEFDDVLIDRSFENDNLPTRKPGIGMLTKYLDGEYDLANSFVIGDRSTDIQLATNLGARAIYIRNTAFPLPESLDQPVHSVEDWAEIYEFLRRPGRTVSHRRTTKETDILIELNLDGVGGHPWVGFPEVIAGRFWRR